MSFGLVPKTVTLNDLERCNIRYVALFHWICWTCVTTHNHVDLWRNLCTDLLCFLQSSSCYSVQMLTYLTIQIICTCLVPLVPDFAWWYTVTWILAADNCHFHFYRAACNADAVLWGDFCPSVCPSVCLSVAWIVTKRKKDRSRFVYHTKEHLA